MSTLRCTPSLQIVWCWMMRLNGGAILQGNKEQRTQPHCIKESSMWTIAMDHRNMSSNTCIPHASNFQLLSRIHPQLLKTNTSVLLSPTEQRIFNLLNLMMWRIIVKTIPTDMCSTKIAKKSSISADQNLRLDSFQGRSLSTKMLALNSVSKMMEHALVESVHQVF